MNSALPQPPPEPAPSGWLGELRATARLAGPIAVAQAGLALMGVVDTAVIGRMGEAPLAGAGLANQIFITFALCGIGVMMGLDPLIAQAIGASDERRSRELLWQGGWLALGLSLVLCVPSALCLLLLRPMGVDPSVVPLVQGVLLARLPGLLPMLIFVGLRSYLQARSRTSMLVIATIAANLLNFALDVLLVFGGRLPALAPLRPLLGWVPALGPVGAGLASSLATFVQAGFLAWDAARAGRREAAAVRRRPSGHDLRVSLRLGLPVGLQMTAEMGVFALVGILAGRLGSRPLAAHQIALTLASFTFCGAAGIGNAGSVRVGWAVGAQDLRGVRRAGWVSLGLGTAWMGACGLAFLLAPGAVTRLVAGGPELVGAAAPVLAVAAAFQIADGVQGVGTGLLRGAGDTRFPFVANLLSHYCVGLPIALWLGLWAHLGVVGLWWGLCAGLFTVAAAVVLRFLRITNRPIARLESHPRPAGPTQADAA